MKFDDIDFRKIILMFVIYKIIVISVAVSTQFFVPIEISNTQRVDDSDFLNPFAQYDATAYIYIAKFGYTNDFGEYHVPNYHWYPLYPLLIHVLSFMGYGLAAFIISNVASFFAIMFLYVLTKEELGKAKAKKTVFYMLFFPTAFYFTMMYTESLFLLFSLAVFYFSIKSNWKYAGLFGFLATLTRMQGVLLLIPAGYIYLRSIKFSLKKINRDSIYFIGFPLGTAMFMTYQYFITGDLFSQFKSAVTYGKSLAWPWEGFLQAINAVATDHTFINVAYHIFNLTMTAAFILLLYVSYKKLKKEYTIYYVLNLVVILVSSNLFGITRYMLIVFPAFMALASLESKDWKMRYGVFFVYAFFILMMIGSIVLHVTERAGLSFLYMVLV